MLKKVNLKNGGAIEVRIENGQIAEVSYSHGITKIAKREEKREIEFRLENIFVDDVEAFKDILRNIKDDADFFSYGRELLDSRRNSKMKTLLDSRRKFDAILAEMQKEVDKYTL